MSDGPVTGRQAPTGAAESVPHLGAMPDVDANGDGLHLVLDATTLQVAFRASLGPFPVRGRFTDVAGMLDIPPSGVEGATLSVDVGAASVTTGLALRDRHLRGHSFLDAGRWPRISYDNRTVLHDNGELLLAGRLTLRGHARDVRMRCQLARDGRGSASRIVMRATLDIPCREHGVGIPIGLDRLNPIFLVVGPRVRVEATIVVPASRLLPALLPALGR